jgi:hypothetical protein
MTDAPTGEGLMSEVTCLELSVILWFAHLACVLGAAHCPAEVALEFARQTGGAEGSTFRAGQPGSGQLCREFHRIRRPRSGAHRHPSTRRTGPTTWIVARVLYLLLYLFDVIYVRTFAWGVALIAILTMMARLTWS